MFAPSDPETRAALSSAAERENLRRYQRYLTEGRRYASLSEEALTAIWIHGLREWVKDTALPHADHEDADAELALRGIPQPSALAADEIAAAVQAVENGIEQLSAEMRDRMVESMIEAHEGGHRPHH